LHQLRGRVGPGAQASSCVLLYQPPLSALARERLAVLRETTMASSSPRRTWNCAGPGEVLGTRQTGRLVIMGGAVNGRGNTHLVPAEFNIGFDPEAAHVVFSNWPTFELVDWEATMRHGLAYDDLEQWLAADDERARFYASVSRRTRSWARQHGRQRMLSADALAMAVALDPSIIVESAERHVGIELAGGLTRGATVVDWEQRMARPANARIVQKVDQGKLENLIRDALGAS
jgi:purine nucleosidase